MARYKSSIDLGAFIGVRHLSINNEEGKAVTGIFIPTAINGIEVRQDSRPEGKANKSGYRVFLNFQQRSYNSAFLDSARQRLIREGKEITAYNIPAYQMCYTLPEERRTVIRAALKKVVTKEHPEWANMEDVKGNELAGAISRMMPYQMGDSYLMEEQQQLQQTYTNAPAAQQVSGYTPAETPAADAAWQVPNEDDLPF